jgi:hypothetical protein
MAFDKDQFRALMKERFSAAAAVPMPVPDPDLPEEQRGPALEASLKIAQGNREDAIAAIAAQAAGMAVSQYLVDAWPAGATDREFDVAPLLGQASRICSTPSTAHRCSIRTRRSCR